MTVTNELAYANPQAFLKSKPKAIVVNNVYHKPFGSDLFLCGQMPLDRRWHIPILEFRYNIEYLRRFTQTIFVVGGEPRFHPDWHNLVEVMLGYPDIDFVVETKIDLLNHKAPVDKANVRYWGEPISKRGRMGPPVLVASCDIVPGQTRRYFWDEARKYCKVWRHQSAPIYDKQAYFCAVAASFDRLFGLKMGWKVDERADCFDQTTERVEQQAEQSCYRCGCALFYKNPSSFAPQNILASAQASVTNLKDITVNGKIHPYYIKQFV